MQAVLVLAVSVLTGRSSLMAQFGDLGLPEPCGLECLHTAAEAAATCREGGGSFQECLEAFAAELQACREAAGCTVPPERPPLCGEECLTAAREGVRACHEGEGDVGECLAAVGTELRACLEAAGCELPPPPDVPPPCGAGCLREALGVARDCFANGGGLRECVSAFREAIETCRATAGCDDGGDDGGDAGEEEEVQVLALMLEREFIRGDADTNSVVNISDPVLVLNFLFLGGTVPACLDGADANDDGTLDISDPAMTLSTLFLGAAPLPAPYPTPGFDATADDPFTCGMAGSE